MARVKRRAVKALALVSLTTALASLAPSGWRLVQYAEAATRSTAPFRASPLDPRVFYEPGAEAMAQEVAAALPAAVATVEQR